MADTNYILEVSKSDAEDVAEMVVPETNPEDVAKKVARKKGKEKLGYNPKERDGTSENPNPVQV